MPTSLVKESDVDVLVIGAGPAGLMACNALAKAGVNVRIIDKRPNKVAAGQADGIQPRTIEVLQSYGLAEALLKEANQIHMAAFYNPGADGGIEFTDRVPDVTASSARYPFEATLHQGAIESLFLDSMRLMGIEVDRPTVPASIQISEKQAELKDASAYPIRVVLKHLEGGQFDTEILHAKFVIGADGAHSWVRKSFDIAMEGEQTNFVWGVLDIVPETDFPDIRNKSAIHSNNGSCMVIPREGDKVRLYIQLGADDAAAIANGRLNKDTIGPHQLLDIARKSFYPYTITTPKSFDWWTIYSITPIVGQRVASKYSIQDRIFIAGDACHTHSPKAGQGMNASMNDTHNLAWKLAQVIRGDADISLLKTYESERRTYAQELIAFDKNFAKMFSVKLKTEQNQDGITHADFLKAFQAYGGFTSGIGIHYGESPIVRGTHQQHAMGITIGQRMPPQILLRAANARPIELQDLLPSDSRFKILIFAGDTSQIAQLRRLESLAEEITQPHHFLRKCSPTAQPSALFEILCISSARKDTVRYNDLPPLFRSHWSSVLIDDCDVRGKQGGDAYHNFGIKPAGDTIVVVRPDGYVGTLAPFNRLHDLDEYFLSFLKPRSSN
ncbi:FAD binding domain-containing protein [Infundibulicybe gibba]|nr:FAD binding domain-containing protein [Infundibulicybe gibba]